jgi:hypothetical protein
MEEADNQWYNIALFETLRSKKRQEELYAIWRTTNIWARPVTWTLSSNHLLWKAIDVVFPNSKGQPTWQGDYTGLRRIATKFWIKNLWKLELCHFEI